MCCALSTLALILCVSVCCYHCYVGGTGVSDIKGARAGLDFAKRFEIIKGSETKNIRLQEVDLSDASAIAAALPR